MQLLFSLNIKTITRRLRYGTLVTFAALPLLFASHAFAYTYGSNDYGTSDYQTSPTASSKTSTSKSSSSSASSTTPATTTTTPTTTTPSTAAATGNGTTSTQATTTPSTSNSHKDLYIGIFSGLILLGIIFFILTALKRRKHGQDQAPPPTLLTPST